MVAPERIAVVDSTQTVMTIGFMAIAAARAARAGKSIQEIVALVESLVPRAFLLVGLETLRYIQQGGRIGRMRAFLGTMLNVKPIFEVRDGEVHPLEQVRTTKRVLARLLELTQSQGPLDELAVLYTTWEEQARSLADQVAATGIIPRERIVISQIGAVIGTHVGPGGLGVNGIRKG